MSEMLGKPHAKRIAVDTFRTTGITVEDE